ncbi:hypothetical protein ACTXT7_015986 [Hymenolepis weldensis]
MHAYSVGDLVYALNHNLKHQWTAAIITKRHGGDIYDEDRKEHLISRSQTTQTRGSLTPEQPLIPERDDQDITPMYHQDSVAFLSISRQRRTGD